MAGRFIPSCDEDGFYRKQQCDRGECWCVDQNGGEVAGSRIRGKPDCGECRKVSDADKKLIFLNLKAHSERSVQISAILHVSPVHAFCTRLSLC